MPQVPGTHHHHHHSDEIEATEVAPTTAGQTTSTEAYTMPGMMGGNKNCVVIICTEVP